MSFWRGDCKPSQKITTVIRSNDMSGIPRFVLLCCGSNTVLGQFFSKEHILVLLFPRLWVQKRFRSQLFCFAVEVIPFWASSCPNHSCWNYFKRTTGTQERVCSMLTWLHDISCWSVPRFGSCCGSVRFVLVLWFGPATVHVGSVRAVWFGLRGHYIYTYIWITTYMSYVNIFR